ncbi:diguanylate cyclase domain-containing protein [Bacillus tuaregi]|uniref:diguanylate cyclase domain-containing protein n=1 Tax=Bacillus tuaregi TaxID=1816695 RepID=UPI0008F7EABA|nr:diguanylate cyclase [Bacillus tuaregi]
MKYTGRIILVLFSIAVSVFESLIEPITLYNILEALFFATIAYIVGWSFDRLHYFRKRAEQSEKYNRELIEYSPESVLVYHQDKIIFVNDRVEELLQIAADQLIGKSIFDFILPEHHNQVKARIQRASSGLRNVERMEIKLFSGKKEILDVEVSSVPIFYRNKNCMEVFIKNITARKKLEEKLRKNEALYRFITENSTDIITYLKPSGLYEYISPSCESILGFSQDELVGKTMFDILHPEEIQVISHFLTESQSHKDFATFPHRIRKKDGSFLWLETNARTIRNSSHELEGIVAVSRDITARLDKESELLETNEMLRYLSLMDGLTDIPNRRCFEEQLQREWNRTMRHSMPLSALMIDIDFFKRFNDLYGHPAGDVCIKQIATVIKNTLQRPADFVARYGGEEFVVLLPETDEDGAAFVSEGILQNIKQLKIVNEGSDIDEYVTISIGCATVFPTSQLKPEDLIEQADSGLYLAKNSGRNQMKIN